MKKDFLKHPEGSIFADGYGIIPKMVMQDPELHIEAKAIYAYLCSFAGQGDTAFPSVKKMCRDLGISKDRYYKYIKELVDRGYIRKQQSIWKNSGQFTNNDYFFVYTVS
mgnify:CR=1 FL=1